MAENGTGLMFSENSLETNTDAGLDFGHSSNCDDSGTNLWIVMGINPNPTQPTMRDWGLIVSWLNHRQMRDVTKNCIKVLLGHSYTGESLPFEDGCLITMQSHMRIENGITTLEPRVECYQICHSTFDKWLWMGEFIGTTPLSVQQIVSLSGNRPY